MTSLIQFYFSERERYIKEEGYGEKTVLLMQIGSFYEILDLKDSQSEGGASKVSQVLNILLTKKNKSIDDSPLMCGFPCVSLNKYLPLLISNGYTVLKYDQITENKRELTEIFSPSTPPDSDIEYSSDPSLVSIYIGDHSMLGVSFINIATGNIEVAELSPNDLINFLISRKPSEIIVNGDRVPEEIDEFIKNKGITCHIFCKKELIKEYLKVSVQEEYLKKIYGPDTGLLGYIVTFDLERFSQTGNILSLMFMFDFLYSHNPRFLESPQIPQFNQTVPYLHLESNTIEQLHIFSENSRSVFKIINHTQTAVGRRHLKWVLSNPFTNPIELNNRYNLTKKLAKDKTRLDLSQIKDIQTLQRSLSCGRLSFSKMNILHSSYLAILNLFKTLTSPCEKILIEFVQEYSNCLKLPLPLPNLEDDFPFLPDFDTDLNDINNEIQVSLEKLNQLEKDLEKIAPIKLIIADERFVFTTTNIRGEIFKKSAKKELGLFFSSNKSGTKIWSDYTEELSFQIFEKKKRLKSLVDNKFIQLQKSWGVKYKDLFNNLVNFVGLIDVCYSNAICAKRFNYCCPSVITEDHGQGAFFDTKNLRHPIIEQLCNFIPNDISLGLSSKNRNFGKIVYSLNSGGKSSLLRSVGVAIVLAQAGLFVPASEFTFSPFNKIISQVDFTDNLFSSKSSFVTEMLGLKSILKNSDAFTLVLADELCKGSEINSATAIFASSITHLLSKNVKFIMSTHLHSVSTLPQIQSFVESGTLKICNLEVRIDPKDNSIIFLRKLKEGPCDTLYGLEIAKALGLEQSVITDAFQIRNALIGQKDTVLSSKRSRYNSKKIMDSCEICNYSPVNSKRDLPLDCHHISFQCDARGNDAGVKGTFCGTKGKEHVKLHAIDNLVSLCKSCHQKVHCGEITINGYLTTTAGKKLIFF